MSFLPSSCLKLPLPPVPQQGQVDCWPLPCPPVDCEFTVVPEGECCPRCITDPCQADTIRNDITKTCTDEHSISRFSGSSWIKHGTECTLCQCKVSVRAPPESGIIDQVAIAGCLETPFIVYLSSNPVLGLMGRSDVSTAWRSGQIRSEARGRTNDAVGNQVSPPSC